MLQNPVQTLSPRLALSVNDLKYYNSASQTTDYAKIFPEAVSRETFCKPTQFHCVQTKKEAICQTTIHCQKIGKTMLIKKYIHFDEFSIHKSAKKIQGWWKRYIFSKKLLSVVEQWRIYCKELEIHKEFLFRKAIKEGQQEKTKKLYPHTKSHLEYWEKELLKWKNGQLEKVRNTTDMHLKRKVNLEILECESKLYRELFHRMHVYQKRREVEKRIQSLQDKAVPKQYSVLTRTPETEYAANLLKEYNCILKNSEDVIEALKKYKNKEIQLLSEREVEFKKRNLKIDGIRHRLGYAFYKFAEVETKQ